MPVLTSLLPLGDSSCPHEVIYLGLGAIFLICCGVVLRRSQSQNISSVTPRTASSPQNGSNDDDFLDEKIYLNIRIPEQNTKNGNHSLPLPPQATQPPPPLPPPQPPYVFSHSTSWNGNGNGNGPDYDSSSPVDVDMNPQSYFDEPLYEDPVSYNVSSSISEPPSLHQIPLSSRSWFDSNPSSYSSLEFDPPIYDSPISSYSSISSVGSDGLPRRRSYTRATSSGGSVSGEIITGDTWRRHTRVFGGGVCKACEESKQKMRERGLASPDTAVEMS